MINQLNIPEMNEVMSNITAIRLTAAKDIGTINILDQWEKRNLSVFNNDQYQYKNQISSDNYSKVHSCGYELCFLWIHSKIRFNLQIID